MHVIYITRAASDCVACHVAIPAGTRACAVARGMSCLGCARIDASSVVIVMRWNDKRTRFERHGASRVARTHAPSDGPFVSAFAMQIRRAFPGMPLKREAEIAEHACAKSGRIGRTPLAKSFDARAIELAVRAHVRHRETRYDAMLSCGAPVWQARIAVEPTIHVVLTRWRGQTVQKQPRNPPSTPKSG